MIGDRNLVGLVNNAGMVVSGPLLYLRISEYRRQLEVNTISPLVVVILPTERTTPPTSASRRQEASVTFLRRGPSLY
jgi:NAD(P)-dependent dehydrogenase (short-subunit alcohol dehydrogenase family)